MYKFVFKTWVLKNDIGCNHNDLLITHMCYVN